MRPIRSLKHNLVRFEGSLTSGMQLQLHLHLSLVYPFKCFISLGAFSFGA